jgi:long-chain acyl-CoA synthetase
MNFIENIFERLRQTPQRPMLSEVMDGAVKTITAGELLGMIGRARNFLRSVGLKKGDRCALLAHNSMRWVAMDLAMIADGIIVVPLYARQSHSELVTMVKDSGASLICCCDHQSEEMIHEDWPEAPPIHLFDEIFSDKYESDATAAEKPIKLDDRDPVTIIYTSGTSGVQKGVVLDTGNVTFMLSCTGARLDRLMEGQTEPDHVFHYLPFCFAGSWILLLSCLSRQSLLTLSTDLNKLAEELKLAAPQYCLNVPALLERIRATVESQIAHKPALIRAIYRKGKEAWQRKREGRMSGLDGVWLALADNIFFKAIKAKIGPNLKALICGSAPLTKETQLFFMMLGISVLQVYGLTETTAICTMDDPRDFTPGFVGPAIPGVEMKIGENEEILVRGPNIFPGYWNRPADTAQAMRNGWFHTGDQGIVDEHGNWAIIGRIKNLIILGSGHNIPPEPIEEKVLHSLPGAAQVVLQGNGRGYLTAIITGHVKKESVERALDAVNTELPHYKHIRGFIIQEEPLTIDGGMLTANGKLKRDAITAHFSEQIEELYEARKQAV